jgi:hypothetical protein
LEDWRGSEEKFPKAGNGRAGGSQERDPDEMAERERHACFMGRRERREKPVGVRGKGAGGGVEAGSSQQCNIASRHSTP